MWLMESVSCIHLKPHPVDYPLAGCRSGICIQSGASAMFMQLDLKTKENPCGGEVSQRAWASWGASALLSAPAVPQGDRASFPWVLMEPIRRIHCITVCILSCFDIVMHEITSLGKALPPLKCSQFPLMINWTETHPPTIAQKSEQNMAGE